MSTNNHTRKKNCQQPNKKVVNSSNANTGGGGQKKSDVMVAAVTARIASTPKTPTHTVRASIFAIIVVVTIIRPHHGDHHHHCLHHHGHPQVVARPTSAVKPLNITSKVGRYTKQLGLRMMLPSSRKSLNFVFHDQHRNNH